RYYVSSPLLHGQPGRAGSVRRVPAAEVEALVARAVREHFKASMQIEDRDLIRNHVVRVEVQAGQLAAELKVESSSDQPTTADNDRLILRIRWRKTSMRRRRDIIVPASLSPHNARPIRAETRATRRWRAGGAGLMRSLPALSPVSSRLLHATNAAFDKSI